MPAERTKLRSCRDYGSECGTEFLMANQSTRYNCIYLRGNELGGIWLDSFASCDLGIDLVARTLQPLEMPFGTRLRPMSRERSVTHVSGMDNFYMVPREGLEPPTP